jgi:hypothetical protein
MEVAMIAPFLIGIGGLLVLLIGIAGLFKAFYKKVDQGKGREGEAETSEERVSVSGRAGDHPEAQQVLRAEEREGSHLDRRKDGAKLAARRVHRLDDHGERADRDRAHDHEVPRSGETVGGGRLLEDLVEALLERRTFPGPPGNVENGAVTRGGQARGHLDIKTTAGGRTLRAYRERPPN